MNDKHLHDEINRLSRSNDDLSKFAYMAAHELQEPLRAIESFTTLLREKYAVLLPGEAKEWLGEAVDGAERLKRRWAKYLPEDSN